MAEAATVATVLSCLGSGGGISHACNLSSWVVMLLRILAFLFGDLLDEAAVAGIWKAATWKDGPLGEIRR
jgi:hypothetical protein